MSARRDAEGMHRLTEGVGRVPQLLVSESDEQTVGNKFNVLAHELGVHTDEGTWEGVYDVSFCKVDAPGLLTCQELLLDLNRLLDDPVDGLGVRPSAEVGEQQAGKVGVETLVTRNELVRESESGHETTLFEPEDGPSTAAKAMRRSAKVDWSSLIHLSAQSAFFLMQGMVSMASKRYVRRAGSLM
jgi:hypothetical protein